MPITADPLGRFRSNFDKTSFIFRSNNVFRSDVHTIRFWRKTSKKRPKMTENFQPGLDFCKKRAEGLKISKRFYKYADGTEFRGDWRKPRVRISKTPGGVN